MILRRVSTTIVLAFSLFGCASQSPQPVEKLEASVHGRSVDKIKTVLVTEMQKRKFRIANETQSMMSFEQPASSTVLQSLSNSDVGKTPTERVTYTIKPAADDILVSAEIAIIPKAGSSPENKIDIGQSGEAQSIRAVLNKVAEN
jgi:hypothetical protein